MAMEERQAGPAGRLISIEGVEGSGKSTQTSRLVAWLARRGVAVVATAEPDGTALGLALRRVMAEVSPLDPLTEGLLFAAARAEHVRRVIVPALARGAVVVSDRYGDSTVAYQGHGRGVDADTIALLNRIATQGVQPDLTVILDLDPAEGLRRARVRPGSALDAFERLPLEFHERVRKGYLEVQAREPGRVVLIDAARSAEEVAARLQDLVAARLAAPSGP